MNKNLKAAQRARRHKRIRAKISGTSAKPRISIFKSNTAISAQIINDAAGKTLAAARGKDAKTVGTELAKKAIAQGVKKVVFDRGGYIYTGKVKAVADAAREGGLEF